LFAYNSENSDGFGRFWGLLSRYAHASPDALALQLKPNEKRNGFEVNLVNSSPKRIDDTAYGIMITLLSQYLAFRGTMENDFSVTDELKKRDKFIGSCMRSVH
jgi:hypothetical protein